VDGFYYINEWHSSAGSTYTASLPLSPGSHTIVVEFYEATGLAYLQYALALTNNIPPSTGSTATIATNMLNVRDAPNPFTGAVLTRVRLGEIYPVIGRNADTSWIQLNVNGVIGWVNRVYVFVPNVQSVPVVGAGSSFGTATVTANFLNVRATPDPVNGLVLERISLGQTYPVIGRNAAGTWVQLSLTNLGLTGWVNANFVSVSNLGTLPVTG
jgi:hypothetical protein